MERYYAICRDLRNAYHWTHEVVDRTPLRKLFRIHGETRIDSRVDETDE